VLGARAGTSLSRAAATSAVATAAVALGALYMVSTILTPLYPLYERAFGFDELVVTEIYATYLVGNLLVLFLLGKLSDQIGRKKVAVAALAVGSLSVVTLLAARSSTWLFLGRGLSGLAAGLGAGALTAWVAELDPTADGKHSALVASAGTLAGLALGSFVGGILARSFPAPLRLSFVVNLALLAVVTAAVLALPETVTRRARSFRELSLEPRLGVPKELRLRFVAPAATAFAVFALGGFYASLAPGLLARRLHEPSVAVLGAVVGIFFGSASAVAGFVPRSKPELELRVAAGLLFAGLGLLVAAELAVSFPSLLAATFLSGGALGLGYRGSLQAINQMAPAGARAELVSSYLLACYVANALPALGVGILSRAVRPEVAHAIFAAVLATLGIVALVAGELERRRATAHA
jgi:MFS family permease